MKYKRAMFLLITEQMRNYWKFRMRMPMRKILRKTMMEDEDDSENNDTGDEDDKDDKDNQDDDEHEEIGEEKEE
jgi:hypothetical protein